MVKIQQCIDAISIGRREEPHRPNTGTCPEQMANKNGSAYLSPNGPKHVTDGNPSSLRTHDVSSHFRTGLETYEANLSLLCDSRGLLKCRTCLFNSRKHRDHSWDIRKIQNLTNIGLWIHQRNPTFFELQILMRHH